MDSLLKNIFVIKPIKIKITNITRLHWGYLIYHTKHDIQNIDRGTIPTDLYLMSCTDNIIALMKITSNIMWSNNNKIYLGYDIKWYINMIIL